MNGNAASITDHDGTARGEAGENPASDIAVNDIGKVWYRTSALNSTLFAVDADGAIVAHMIYDPFGNALMETYTEANFSGLDNLNNFTGYTWEGLMARAKEDPEILRFLGWLDVVVDGPFVQALRDRNLLFRGSGNQRILDVKASLAAGEAVWTKDPAWVGEDGSARAEG